MADINLAGVDLNLLPALEALLRRRHVTRAAEDVGLSQPAMSRALSRLRDLLEDELLVRSGQGLVLTPKAQALVPVLATALGEVKLLFRPPQFDPSTERRVVRIAASDTQTILLAPAIMARLAREAPGVDLRMVSYREDIVSRMEDGSIDLAFAIDTVQLPPGARTEVLFEDRLAIVTRRTHPAAQGPWAVEDYARFDHVGVSMLDDGISELDTMLAAAGVTRRMALTTPHFMAALATVAATDLVTTISRAFARRFVDVFDLVLNEPPFDDTSFKVTLVWGHVRATDPMLIWLRGLIREVALEQTGEH